MHKVTIKQSIILIVCNRHLRLTDAMNESGFASKEAQFVMPELCAVSVAWGWVSSAKILHFSFTEQGCAIPSSPVSNLTSDFIKSL